MVEETKEHYTWMMATRKHLTPSSRIQMGLNIISCQYHSFEAWFAANIWLRR
jgi:hypothetical protein